MNHVLYDNNCKKYNIFDGTAFTPPPTLCCFFQQYELSVLVFKHKYTVAFMFGNISVK